MLKQRGVKKGDRISIYMPMVAEAAVAMLACTRIGAVHSVVFGGFSPESIKDRDAFRPHVQAALKGVFEIVDLSFDLGMVSLEVFEYLRTLGDAHAAVGEFGDHFLAGRFEFLQALGLFLDRPADIGLATGDFLEFTVDPLPVFGVVVFFVNGMQLELDGLAALGEAL